MGAKINPTNRGIISKWALRQILYKYVPPELIERPKAGFGIPIGQWLRGPLRPWAEDLLQSDLIKRQDYLRAESIHNLWKEHLSGRFDHSAKIWRILMLQSWFDS